MFLFLFYLSHHHPVRICVSPFPFTHSLRETLPAAITDPGKASPIHGPKVKQRERRRRRRKSRDVLPCQITAERSKGKFPPASGGGEMLLLLLSGIILQTGRAKVSDPRLVIHSRKIFGSLFACASNRIACRGRPSLPFLLFRESGCLRLQKRRFSCME